MQGLIINAEIRKNDTGTKRKAKDKREEERSAKDLQ